MKNVRAGKTWCGRADKAEDDHCGLPTPWPATMKLEGNCSAWKDCMITKIHEMQE